MIQRTFKKGDIIGQKYQVHDVLDMGGCDIVYLVYDIKSKIKGVIVKDVAFYM